MLLEVYTRRFYRIRQLRDLAVSEHDGWLLGAADYDVEGTGTIHLVTAYAPLAELPELSRAIAGHLATADAGREVVVDLALWRHGETSDVDAVVAEAEKLLAGCDFGRLLHRLDLTVTTVEGAAPERFRTHHVTYRQRDGQFVEDPLYRNLHPMLAKRLDLWRLANFELRRLRSAEDVYVFHGVAHDNPADHRLFALAEVRDLTPARDAGGAVRYPRLELMGLLALSAMREALATFDGRDRPAANRIVLYVRPPWDVPRDAWTELARSLAPLAVGAGLEKVVLRVRLPRRSRPCARGGGAGRGRDGARTPAGTGADPVVDAVPAEAVARQPLRRPVPVRDRADAHPAGRGGSAVSRRAVRRVRPRRAREPRPGVATVRA